ncbi:hypothetical protein [Yinghuangia sp. YIM S09857]|uniref:hypothetical protein n=1 Tax=Yinghuangia sp. YIM S09857 TaxID=3436929 RepID=UPI003F52F1E3
MTSGRPPQCLAAYRRSRALEDVARTFAALALDLTHINGQTIVVDGGQDGQHLPRRVIVVAGYRPTRDSDEVQQPVASRRVRDGPDDGDFIGDVHHVRNDTFKKLRGGVCLVEADNRPPTADEFPGRRRSDHACP